MRRQTLLVADGYGNAVELKVLVEMLRMDRDTVGSVTPKLHKTTRMTHGGSI